MLTQLYLEALRRINITQKELSKQLNVSQATVGRWLKYPEELPISSEQRLAKALELNSVHYTYDPITFNANLKHPAIDQVSSMPAGLFPAWLHQAMEWERIQHMLKKPLQNTAEIHPSLKTQRQGWYLGYTEITSPLGDLTRLHRWYLLQAEPRTGTREAVSGHFLMVMEYPNSTKNGETEWSAISETISSLSILQKEREIDQQYSTENLKHFKKFEPSIQPIRADAGDQAFYLKIDNNQQEYPSNYICIKAKGNIFRSLIELIHDLERRITMNRIFSNISENPEK